MNKDRIMYVTDEKGNQIEMYILFTTKLEDYDKSYVFYYNPKDLESGVFVSAYNDNGELFSIENEEEWKLLDEVFQQFQEDASNSKCSGCTKDCDGEYDGSNDCDNCDK